MAANVSAVDLEGSEGGQMSGVFRWKASHVFRSLPSWTKAGSKFPPEYLYTSWSQFFLSKCQDNNVEENGPELLSYVHSDLSLVDCLSFPLSVIYGGIQSKILPLETKLDAINLICIGCSAKAEERVLRQTECWEEVALAYRSIETVNLWLVGPEISKTQQSVKDTRSSNRIAGHLAPNRFIANTFKGTSNEFFKEHRSMLPSLGSTADPGPGDTLVVGLNCGFGNFENPGLTKYDLLCSWYGDLSFLTAFPTLPCIFTCANDYADCRGESLVMSELLGARFVLPPTKNEFTCASTFIPPHVELSGKTVPEYSCGNSYFYAVQGNVADKRKEYVRRLPAECRLTEAVQSRYRAMDTLIKTRAGTAAAWQAQVRANMHTVYCSPLIKLAPASAPAPAPAPAPDDTAEALVGGGGGQAVDWQVAQEKRDAEGLLRVTLSLPAHVKVADVDVFVTNAGDELCVTSSDNREERLAAPVKLVETCDATNAQAKYSKKRHQLTITAAIAGDR